MDIIVRQYSLGNFRAGQTGAGGELAVFFKTALGYAGCIEAEAHAYHDDEKE